MLGKPMVSCEIGTGTSFVIAAGETGIVVEPDNPVALAAAMNRLFEDGALSRKYGLAARERYEKLFSTAALGRAYAGLYQGNPIDATAPANGQMIELDSHGGGLMRQKLQTLLHKLENEQHKLLLNVAEKGIMPSNGVLEKVAQLELNISAIENTIDRLTSERPQN
jgi:hypothetical protein